MSHSDDRAVGGWVPLSATHDLTRDQAIRMYRKVHNDGDVEAQRELCRRDLFYLLTIACKRIDANHDWIYDRCREVEQEPDSMLDLWSRGHYKSTIITFALSIQEILRNPEVTIGIFSHTSSIAKDFLIQIKTELEDNDYLQKLFPDILFANPQRESPRWGTESGIVVKRKTNPKEATVEAWGVVIGQPTGRHFMIRVYDDMVTDSSVTTPDMINKTTDSWALSMNLGSTTGAIVRYIGTRYHFNDTYRAIIERDAATPRIRLCSDEDMRNPVLLTPKELQDKRKMMGPYIFSCQMLQNPVADKAMGFREDWLEYYSQLPSLRGWNIYITVDPAGEKKKDNDYTVMAVIGLAPDQSYYLIDAVRDRLNLTERADQLFKFVRKYDPIRVGYEKYGLQADVEHMKFRMELENFRFPIRELGGTMAKNDRIRRLVPIFEQGRFRLPRRLLFLDREERQRDFTAEFVHDEFVPFPVAVHDDMLDCISRITDPDLTVKFPKAHQRDSRKGPKTQTNNTYKVI